MKKRLKSLQIMSIKKKFDFTTLFVILVSVALILFGMYFLNQSFTKKSAVSKPEYGLTQSKSINSSITNSSSTLISSSETKSVLSEKTVETTVATSSSSSTSLISKNSSKSSSSTSSSTKNNSPLLGSEAKIKILQSLGGGTYEAIIIDTGIKDPKFWIKDKKLKINNNSTLKIDTEYRVSEITETSNSFNYGSIDE